MTPTDQIPQGEIPDVTPADSHPALSLGRAKQVRRSEELAVTTLPADAPITESVPPASAFAPTGGGGSQATFTPSPEVRKKRSAARSVYFRDEEQLERLDTLAKKFPRASVSSIIQQLTDAFLQASSDQMKEEDGIRQIHLNTVIYL